MTNDTHPRRTAALASMAERGEEPAHATYCQVWYHGHGPICCCLMQLCRKTDCNVNAEIIRQIEAEKNAE